MTHTIILTPEYVKRVNSSIVETRVLISREMGISKDLRYTNKIQQWEKHIEKLEAFLKAGVIVNDIPE